MKSYIKILGNDRFQVLSRQGQNVGVFFSKEAAQHCVATIERRASESVDLSDLKNLSYSAVLRKLRQSGSQELVRDFIKLYYVIFQKLVLEGKQNIPDRALAFSLRYLNKKHSFSVSNNATAVSMNLISAPRFSQIQNGLFRGGEPSEKDVQTLYNSFGVRRIVSLDQEAAEKISNVCQELGIQHIVLPIESTNLRSVSKLSLLDWTSILLDGGPCYLHCLHGKDRTGLVTALFRCQEGWSSERAIAEADKFDFCKGLPAGVRRLYERLIASAASDENKVWELPTPDFMADYKFNNEYNEPNFAIQTSDVENAVGQKAIQNQNIPEYNKDFLPKDIPLVGLNDNVSNVTVPGPSSIGTGFIATV